MMILSDSPRSSAARSFTRSAGALAAAVETGRIGRPADKREFLPRFRSTIAGPLQERTMKDDELLPRPVSGLKLLIDTPQGTPLQVEITPEQEMAWQKVLADNRARRASPEWQAEQKRKEEQAVFSANIVFADMDWYYNNVLSWIAYRDPRLIEKCFSGLRYNKSPKLVERKPRSVLLLALQKGAIVARRNIDGTIEKVEIDDWLSVRRTTLPIKWPKHIVFNSDEVKDFWKPVATIKHERAAASETKATVERSVGTRGPPPTQFNRTKAAILKDLRSGSLRLGEKQETLAKTYGVSRDTATRAFRAAMSEFETPTNSDTK